MLERNVSWTSVFQVRLQLRSFVIVICYSAQLGIQVPAFSRPSQEKMAERLRVVRLNVIQPLFVFIFWQTTGTPNKARLLRGRNRCEASFRFSVKIFVVKSASRQKHLTLVQVRRNFFHYFFQPTRSKRNYTTDKQLKKPSVILPDQKLSPVISPKTLKYKEKENKRVSTLDSIKFDIKIFTNFTNKLI